jgi:plasmid maintenance system antidote protein VapI
MNFSKVVITRLSELNMSKKKLAEAIGFSHSHLINLISGNRGWSEETINNVCKALNLVIKFEEKVS